MRGKVITRIYKNLKSDHVLLEAAQNEQSTYSRKRNYELYVDVFDSYKSAKSFYYDCMSIE